jgi:multidrug efflux pump subunit AcrA (membrane-fusion protein)
MRRDEVDAARATVSQLDQQLQEVMVRQRDTRLIAPMDGVVSRRYIEEDELVTSGVSTFSSGTPVLQIADLSVMLVQMTVNEVDVHECRPGLPVEIEIDGARGRVFRGLVQQVAPSSLTAASPGGGGGGAAGGGGTGGGGASGVIRFAVKVRVDRPDPLLRPGMSARCAIVTARRQDVLRVPEACVPATGSSAEITLLKDAGEGESSRFLEEKRRVTLGLRGNGYVEVRSGLKEGDRVTPQAFTGPPRQGLDINVGD